MRIKDYIKDLLSVVRWCRVRRRFKHISSMKGFRVHGKIINPQYMEIGENRNFAKGFLLHCNPAGKAKPKLTIGDSFWTRDNLTILCSGRVTIGNNVTFAKDVFICDQNHGINPETENYRKNPLIIKSVTIGDGCWLGGKVCVLPGVTIGKKVIIGAGSVVTKDIPAYCIAAGNPCRVIKSYNAETKTWEPINGK